MVKSVHQFVHSDAQYSQGGGKLGNPFDVVIMKLKDFCIEVVNNRINQLGLVFALMFNLRPHEVKNGDEEVKDLLWLVFNLVSQQFFVAGAEFLGALLQLQLLGRGFGYPAGFTLEDKICIGVLFTNFRPRIVIGMLSTLDDWHVRA